MQNLIPYLLIINAAALLLMLQDKKIARTHRGRVPEAVLLATAVLGGSLGATVGMLVFRHKTRKPVFSIGLPVLLLLQVGVLLLSYRFTYVPACACCLWHP